MTGSRVLGTALLIAFVAAAGCAAGPRVRASSRALLGDHPRVALLPLEDLSSSAGAGERLTRIFFAALARSGACEVADPGEVDAALEALHLRNTFALAPEPLRALGDTLRVRYVLVGSVIESGTVHTPDGEVPAVGVTLRLVETQTARVAWAGMDFRSGEDRETVFGWGRERNAEKLAAQLADEMIRALTAGAKPAPGAGEGGTP